MWIVIRRGIYRSPGGKDAYENRLYFDPGLLGLTVSVYFKHARIVSLAN